MSKLNKGTNQKSVQKRLSVNLLAVGGMLLVDCIAMMTQSTIRINTDKADVIAQQVMNFGIFSYIVIFIFGFMCFKAIEKLNKSKIRKSFLVMIVLSVFNMMTFIVGGYWLSIWLLVPITMMVYLRECAKRELKGK